MNTVVIIDGLHLHLLSKHLGFTIDYTKLRETLREQFGAVRFRNHVAVGSAPSFDQVRGLLAWMRDNGYTVLQKEFVRNEKSNVVVDIAVDIMEQVLEWEQNVVLICGNGAVLPAVERVRRLGGGKVTLISERGHVSRELAGEADQFVALSTLVERIKKANGQ